VSDLTVGYSLPLMSVIAEGVLRSVDWDGKFLRGKVRTGSVVPIRDVRFAAK
jgi:hypothetical protein